MCSFDALGSDKGVWTAHGEVRWSLSSTTKQLRLPLNVCCRVTCGCRIEPDGQRPKVLIHGKACRKTANPKCAYDTSDTRSGIEVRGLT